MNLGSMDETLQFPPLTKKGRNAADFAFETLCKSILEGEYKPGQRIREVEIAEALGISRTPIREALRKLEEQHLVDKQINGAYFIANWDDKTLLEIAALRGALEGLAFSLAIKNISEKDFLFLEEIVQRMDMPTRRKDFERLVFLDIQFHHYVWLLSGNTLLQETLSQMTPQIRYLMVLTRTGGEDEYPQTHQELIDVLKGGDPAQARETVQNHIQQIVKLFVTQN